MKRLQCPVCGHDVFFDSLRCVHCGTELVLDVGAGGSLTALDIAITAACADRTVWACNWRAEGEFCPSCVLVDAGDHALDAAMVTYQRAQRRALYQLRALSVPWGPDLGLRFRYRSKAHGDVATIGHRGGEITLDLDEADAAHQEEIKATLGELYRTPLGHLRHELGHFVWLTLVAPHPDRMEGFRERFGDERIDYGEALDAHYARLDDGSWQDQHASFYASAHPWEDFAESWAQLLHVHDVVETSTAWGTAPPPASADDARAWLAASATATIAANELARSMGTRDLYPFTLSPGAQDKVRWCWTLVEVAPVPT